jgi:hypothetical protein
MVEGSDANGLEFLLFQWAVSHSLPDLSRKLNLLCALGAAAQQLWVYFSLAAVVLHHR